MTVHVDEFKIMFDMFLHKKVDYVFSLLGTTSRMIVAAMTVSVELEYSLSLFA